VRRTREKCSLVWYSLLTYLIITCYLPYPDLPIVQAIVWMQTLDQLQIHHFAKMHDSFGPICKGRNTKSSMESLRPYRSKPMPPTNQVNESIVMAHMPNMNFKVCRSISEMAPLQIAHFQSSG
jgi:hypothetical protein